VTSTSAFRFFAESSAIWDRERLSAVGGFDERLGPPQPFGAEEGAEVLGRVLADGGAARFEPVVVVVHPAFDRVDRAKAFRYGRGTGGALWITSSWWMRRYSVMSAIRRVGGVVRCAWRRDGAGVAHRLSWLAGFAVGLLTGWRVRSRPGRTGTDGVIRRV
jgi:hypothetical protein